MVLQADSGTNYISLCSDFSTYREISYQIRATSSDSQGSSCIFQRDCSTLHLHKLAVVALYQHFIVGKHGTRIFLPDDDGILALSLLHQGVRFSAYTHDGNGICQVML